MHPSGHSVVQGPWGGRSREPRCDCAGNGAGGHTSRGDGLGSEVGGCGSGARFGFGFGFGFGSGSGLGGGSSGAHRELERRAPASSRR